MQPKIPDYINMSKEDICAHCGGYKYENKAKHLQEVSEFLERQINKLKEIKELL